MAGSPGTLKNALEEWLQQNFPSGYTSCIKIHGRPILPPLMSEERRIEMRRLRDVALEVERRVKAKKDTHAQEDTAGGEAMYEGVVDELHFADSLPDSLAANSGCCSVLATCKAKSPKQLEDCECDQVLSTPTTSEMLKEFDPLSSDSEVKSADHLFDLCSGEISEKLTRSSVKTVSKPSSAESSVALSYSTDLNNYMDVTEVSVDVSLPFSDGKSTSGTGVTTPSTIRPDSSSSKSHSGVPWRDGKTTYEDLNNYLDNLLNNNGATKKQRPIKDSNQNLVNTSSSSRSSRRTISPSNFVEGPKPQNTSPPPLTSPQGSLQTRLVTDNNRLISATSKNADCAEASSDFLQSCALSPVRSDIQNSYEQKVQLYLQNLMIDEALSQQRSSEQPQCEETKLKETVPSKSVVNGDVPQTKADPSFNGFVQAPPRLVRSNSYTLDTPSPMLLAHMEAELRKNVRNEPAAEERAPQNLVPSRRVWDVETSKNMPSWCNRQSNVSSAGVKPQSPKKVLNRSVSAQPSVPASLERKGSLSDPATKQASKIATKSNSDSPKRKPLTASQPKETADEALDKNRVATDSMPSVCDNSKDKVGSLLVQLQLQHNKEMEELLNRQRKEKEAIRLAMLEEQQVTPLKTSHELNQSLSLMPAETFHILGQSQSPPTKDKVLQLERRNTSPSMYENKCEVQTGRVQGNKSSSASLNNSALVDIGKEERAVRSKGIPYQEGGEERHRGSSSNTSGYFEYQLGPGNSYYGSSDMIASFPPSGLPSSNQLQSMTSSLPPEILSLHFSNTELTFQNANSVSCTAQSSLISISKPADGTQNILTSAFTSNMTGGSPQNKRRSWCSRQLFPDDFLQNHPDWVTQSQQQQAATKIQAGVRGYLTRRLLKTERVQNCITTIRDTIVCALQLQRECAPHVEPSDLQLHGRLIQQLSAACEDLHNIFMGLPVHKRMAIIAADRERLRVRTPRSQSSGGSRPLSRATQIVLQRKMNQSDPSDSNSLHSRASSASRSRRRSWATVDSRARPSPLPTSIPYNCEVISGCLSRTSAPTSLPLQRSASAGSSRKPWR